MEKFPASFDWHATIPDGSDILCAVSGGPDSTALLNLLTSFRHELKFNLYAAHLNHGIRNTESDADEQFVREMCNQLDIPLEVESIDFPSLAGNSGMSMEMLARQKRYDFLVRTARILGCGFIATGHNSDDRVENLLLRLFRGSGGRGLGSLKPVSERDGITLIRPLLNFSRKWILEYLENNGLKYRVDSSNLSLDTDRCRIRNEILPNLEFLAQECGFGDIRASLGRSAELLAIDDSFINELVNRDYTGFCLSGDNGITFMSDGLHNVPDSVVSRLILKSIENLDPGIRMESGHIRAIEKLIRGECDITFDIPGPFRVSRDGDIVRIYDTSAISEPVKPGPVGVRSVDLPLDVQFGEHLLKINLVKWRSSRTFSPDSKSSGCVEFILPDGLKEFEIRAMEPGDFIDPLGMDGHTKKIGDIFTDNKIPARERHLQPLIAIPGEGRILAIPKLGIIAESLKITENVSEFIWIIY